MTDTTPRNFLYDIQRKKKPSDPSMGTVADLEDRKNVLDLNILVCVDVSGSIGASTFRKFMAQIDAIKGLSRVRVLEVDTEVVAIYDYFKVKSNLIVRLGGGGGTCLGPAFDKARIMKPDAILFMTDGFVADTVADPKIPTGWVLTHDGRQPYSFGEIVVRLGSQRPD